MEFKDSQTYQNLKNAYAGERLASTKYKIYADRAREEGYKIVGDVFDETSGNEKEHAEVWLRQMNGGELPDTLQNLEEAYSGEVQEWRCMYPEYAKKAMEEGYPEIARLFEMVSNIERRHDYNFEQLAQQLAENRLFCDDEKTLWTCTNCGNPYYGECAPKYCPVCGFPQGYFIQEKVDMQYKL